MGGRRKKNEVVITRKFESEIVAVEIIRVSSNKTDTPFFTRDGGYKFVLRTNYDQFMLFPKQMVEYKGRVVSIEDLAGEFFANALLGESAVMEKREESMQTESEEESHE
jgi:hypothetical protein